MEIRGNHPLAEVIAKSLFGIESNQWTTMMKQRMVNRAVKNSIAWHNKEMDKQCELCKLYEPTEGKDG